MKGRILTSLLAAFAIASIQAQTVTPTPKLVVGITIDQLRSDYLEAFSALYGEKGFKRLLREGVLYDGAYYDYAQPDRASAIATLFSGTNPYNHGVVGEEWMDRSTSRVITAVDDKAYMGIYTAENSSPAHLLVSTVPDELKMATQGKAIVYAIAPFRDAAVFAAGHAADGAFWINDDTGKWAGSTYYGSFPSWVITYNDRMAVDTRIASLAWEPYHSPKLYTYFQSADANGFKYRFTDAYHRYRSFKTSGLVNEEVNRLATNCLKSTQLGMDEVTDFLSVTYYAGAFEHKSPLEHPVEIQDTYARLDRQIEELLTAAEKKVGAQNLFVFVTSTGYVDAETTDMNGTYHIPTGEFRMDRCTALLNMYLTASYGQGKYVDTYHGREIYLDRKLIEKKQLNLAQVLATASEFLSQFSGVKAVYTSQSLSLNAVTPDAKRVRNAYHPFCSGDLVVEIAPGWKLMNEYAVNGVDYQVVRDSYTAFPLIFWGAGTRPQTLHTPVTVDRIAPTLTHFMRIRAPNACGSAPLTDYEK